MVNDRAVLIIDDDNYNLQLYSSILKLHYIDSVCVRSGAEGLRAIKKHNFDAVLLDYMMPEMNGLEVLQTIRKEYSAFDLPVIMATSCINDDFVHSCFNAGANDFIGKPASQIILVARLKAHMQLKHSISKVIYDVERSAYEQRIITEAVIDAPSMAVVTFDKHGLIENFSAGAEKILKCPQEQALGKRFLDFFDVEYCVDGTLDQDVVDELFEIVAKRLDDKIENKVWQSFLDRVTVIPCLAADGSKFFSEMSLSEIDLNGRTIYSVILRDISDKVIADERLEYLTKTNSMTGLPNSRSFQKQVHKTIAEDAENSALVYIDVDDLKEINHNHSYHVGNMIIKAVGLRLRTAIGEGDFLAHHGADEFQLMLCPDPSQNVRDYAEGFLDRIVALLSEPIELNHHDFHVSVSIGVVLYPEDSKKVADLYKMADVALYQAKASGKKGYRFYDSTIHQEAQRKKYLLRELNVALSYEEDIYVYFQPQIDLQDQSITGYECLMRWIHKTEGFIPPDEFIDVAESNDMIILLGWFVINKALDFVQALEEEGDLETVISINISPSELAVESYLSSLKAAMDASSIPAERICLEVTERVMASENFSVVSRMEQIKKEGISISIDDFGTGYSSLSYLKNFPVNELKIDKSFIDGIPDDNGHVAIIDAVVGMSNAMNLRLVAEGVETQEQFDFLKERYKGAVQGYLFTPAKPKLEILDWAKQYNASLVRS